MPHFLNGNYIDLIIILILIYYVTEAFRHGFWVIMADFISFFGSLILSFRFYKYVASFLRINFSLNLSVANAIGYLFAAIIFESALSYITGYLIHKLPERLKKHRLNRLLGILPAIGEGLVIVSFLLTLVLVLPIKPQVKTDVTDSKVGSYILEKTTFLENTVNEVFGEVINDSLTYLTIKTESKESIPLDIDKLNLKTDEKAELDLFRLVNEERRKLAITELVWDLTLIPVARDHAKDMWERKYFSHYSPENKNVGDRLNVANIKYSFAGENLALAPTTKTAHTGLMNSKGHRENILDSKFKKIGIGVIDNDFYGKMFVQVFTD